MHYLDASLIVALLTPLPHSERAHAWFAAQQPGSLCISGWAATEVASALSIKMRTGSSTLELRSEALNAWGILRHSSLLALAVTEAHPESASDFALRHELNLRAGDALHVATAQAGAHTLARLDARMADAALQLGIAVARV